MGANHAKRKSADNITDISKNVAGLSPMRFSDTTGVLPSIASAISHQTDNNSSKQMQNIQTSPLTTEAPINNGSSEESRGIVIDEQPVQIQPVEHMNIQPVGSSQSNDGSHTLASILNSEKKQTDTTGSLHSQSHVFSDTPHSSEKLNLDRPSEVSTKSKPEPDVPLSETRQNPMSEAKSTQKKPPIFPKLKLSIPDRQEYQSNTPSSNVNESGNLGEQSVSESERNSIERNTSSEKVQDRSKTEDSVLEDADTIYSEEDTSEGVKRSNDAQQIGEKAITETTTVATCTDTTEVLANGDIVSTLKTEIITSEVKEASGLTKDKENESGSVVETVVQITSVVPNEFEKDTSVTEEPSSVEVDQPNTTDRQVKFKTEDESVPFNQQQSTKASKSEANSSFEPANENKPSMEEPDKTVLMARDRSVIEDCGNESGKVVSREEGLDQSRASTSRQNNNKKPSKENSGFRRVFTKLGLIHKKQEPIKNEDK